MKVDIYRSDMDSRYNVIFYKEVEGMFYEVFHFDEKGQITFTKHQFGEQVVPTMKVPTEMLKALGDAIAGLGIKTDSDMKREGLLEWLNDMKRAQGYKKPSLQERLDMMKAGD